MTNKRKVRFDPVTVEEKVMSCLLTGQFWATIMYCYDLKCIIVQRNELSCKDLNLIVTLDHLAITAAQ